jgi:simple sugar transport system ATP-binding protein
MASNRPSVRLCGLSKRFGEVQAVHQTDLDLFPGEIHAVLGENGAGKSTLMSMLAGLYRPDAGRIELEGESFSFRSPRDAMAASVGMVHQHFMLVPTLTVWENVLLGAKRIPAMLRPARQKQHVQQTAERLGLRVDAGSLVGDLSVGEQQRVEILRVLMRGARVMILDEPTAVLSPRESEALFVSLERLCQAGCTLVLISHKLAEVRRVAQRVTVMRRGQVVARYSDPRSLSVEELAAAMVGHQISLELDRPRVERGTPLLAVSDLRVRSSRGIEAVCGVSIEVRAGEILGLAGVAGNGQVELMEAVAGLRPAVHGTVALCGQDLGPASARQRADLGLRYVPEDRNRTGTAPSLSVAENLALRRYLHPPARRGPWLQLRALEEYFRERVSHLQISTAGLDQATRLLSGGNLQKVILARELTGEARVILAVHPTRGLDAAATAQVRQLLLNARSAGAAVLLWSEDLDELLALSDRVAVIASGRIVATLDHDQAELTTVGRLMTGGA